jgi:hypothetical protein
LDAEVIKIDGLSGFTAVEKLKTLERTVGKLLERKTPKCFL